MTKMDDHEYEQELDARCEAWMNSRSGGSGILLAIVIAVIALCVLL